jgi:hypothetical protein
MQKLEGYFIDMKVAKGKAIYMDLCALEALMMTRISCAFK